MSSTETQYVLRSWKMFTQEKGWIMQAVILMLAMLVPIVGLFGVAGYSLEWARRTAWGSDAAPRRCGVDVGKCMVSGGRAALISIGYNIIFWPVSRILSTLLSVVFPSDAIVNIILSVCNGFISVIILIAVLNATMYQRVGAGYDIKHIYSMIRSGYRGLISIFVAQIVYSFCLGAFIVLYILQIFGLMFFPFVVAVLGAFGMVSLVFGSFVLLQIAFVLALVGSTMIFLINANALGLWMRQFDIASWGAPFSSVDASPNQNEFSALPLPEDVQSSETPDISASAPIPPQGSPTSFAEAAQSQSRSLSSDVSSAGSAQVGDAAGNSNEERTGHDTEEDDKTMQN